MKISRAASLATIFGGSDALWPLRLRSRFNHKKTEVVASAEEPNRELQVVGCNGVEPLPPAAWHPTTPNGSWPDGFCALVVDCNSPSYDTELECCNGAFGGQASGTCLSNLPSPPTESPTESGPLDVYYPDYDQPSWAEGFCINTRPLPSGRPSYDTMLGCCNAAYGGQATGKCISMLPSPPTTSPTESGGLDVYYPDYDQPSWAEGFCINDRPLPSGRPTFATMLECCNGAFGGQLSGTCISMLPSPPTTSPTESGGLDMYYPDYDTSWAEGFCINSRPLPSGRPTYATMLECCNGAYGGQVSGKCISELPSPPTTSPTESGALDAYYADYDNQPSWAEGFCINTRPLPDGRLTYATMLECCDGAYGGQVSGECISRLPSVPTMSPTESGGLDAYYPDYDNQASWAEGFCINTRPLPSGRPTYETMLDCCNGAYGGQVTGKCISMLPSPPTTSPTESGGLDMYYPDYDQPSWAEGFCVNTRPLPSGRPTYETMLDCCNGAYGGQVSGKCISMLPSPPTTSPTESGDLDVYYADYDNQPSWAEGFCTNTRPLPDGRPTYDTVLECCNGAYGGQVSGKCISMLPSPPTTSPTEAGGLDVFYPDYDNQPSWAEGFCVNTRPLPSGRPTFDSLLECCDGAYRGQVTGTCLSMLPSPPTSSPTETGGLDVFYPDYEQPWTTGFCTNVRPMPSGRPTYDTMLACCNDEYGGQDSGTCVSMLLSPPTTSPTATGGADMYYPDISLAFPEGFCINTLPVPSGSRMFDTILECCNVAYGGQVSGKCISMLPSPPTLSPTESGGLDVFYADYSGTSWPDGVCINTSPLPSGRPSHASKEVCCAAHYGGQVSNACMCDAVGICYACSCGSEVERNATGGCPDLTCS